jgi:phage baseplate assembly protein W
MSRRSPADLDRLMRQLGTDLALSYASTAGMWEDADLIPGLTMKRTPRRKDVVIATEIASAEQLLVNRIKTHKGELTALGHPEYGSRHHELIGEPNVQRTRNLIKLHVLEALSHEPRIEKILSCEVSVPPGPVRDQVRIAITARLIDQPDPLNLVVPFSLEVSA